MGSSHGHVDPNNEAIFKGTSTVNTDYIKQPFSRATQALDYLIYLIL